jgi:thioredoxin reductase (NADPH)
MYDCIIVGASVAGVSAAVNLKIRQKDFLLIGNKNFSAKVEKAELIRNFIGLPDISGKELSQAINKHLEAMDITITEKRINSVLGMKKSYMLESGSEILESRTIILATGVEFTKKVKGEDEFLGQGVSYCATCDGELYRGKTIAVVGSSKDAEEELIYLAGLAGKVYYVPLYAPEENFVQAQNVELVRDKPEAVLGTKSAEKLLMKSGRQVEVSGIFFLKDALAPSSLVHGLKDDGVHIIVNRQMETNLPGCFACGDCTGRPYQYIKAAGEGYIAAHSVVSYLAKIQAGL